MGKGEIIQRGNQAKDLLKNGLLEEVFEELTLNTFQGFLSSNSQSDDERLKLWSIGQALQLLKGKLDSYIEDAKIEEYNKKLDEEKHGD